MTAAIQTFLAQRVGRHFCVFICAMLPIIELRGAIPMGAALGLPFYEVLPLALLGNLLPVPFILLLIRAVLNWMKKRRGLQKIALWVEERARRRQDKILRLQFTGLLLFVALPLPGTGAWMGSLIAALLQMDWKKSFLFIAAGVLLAGILMTLASYGVVGFLSFLA